MLNDYLSKFEKMVDIDHHQSAKSLCIQTLQFLPVKALPHIFLEAPSVPDEKWPEFPYNEAFDDAEKMLLNELKSPFLHNQTKDYRAMNIRCNYGTVILPSLFGAKYKLTEESMPWSDHFESRDQIRNIVEKGIPDYKNGLGGKCFETAEYYKSILSGYPKLNQVIRIYHPDLQGPFDVAHLL
ncbi:MAG: hypothetical protein ABIA63_08495, partial [bacterium]